MSSLSYRFQRPELLELALTHASTGSAQDNERLEFLGDAALDLIVARELFERFPDLAEGALTEIKASIVSRRNLALVSSALGLDAMIKVGRGMHGGALTTSVLANVYEALLGAIYLDGGFEAAREWAREGLGAQIDGAISAERDGNPKQTLQHFAQGRGTHLPNYVLLETRGSAHAKVFSVAVELEGERFAAAWGRTRKEAERWAAFEALLVLRERGDLRSDTTP